MTNDELNKALYEKMAKEFQEYKNWLLTLPKEEILQHANEFTTKADILTVVQEEPLPDAEASSLLQSPSPLEDVYKDFTKLETDYKETVRETMEARADILAEKQEDTKMITVIKVEPGKAAYIKEIENSLKSLQSEVGGDVECVYPFEDQVGIVCNQESKFNGMEMNRCLRHPDTGNPYDILYGPFLVTGLTEDDFGSLSKDLQDKYLEKFEQPEMFVMTENGVMVLPMPTEDFPMNQEFESGEVPTEDGAMGEGFAQGM